MNYLPYFILLGFLISALYFIFRKRKLTAEILSKVDLQTLNIYVDFYAHLDRVGKQMFEQKVVDFLNVVKIEGVELEVTPVDRLLIASSAVIPIFGFDNWQY